MTDQDGNEAPANTEAERRALSPAAERALKEAAERRRAYEAAEASLTVEPGRYGDWEVKGLTSDF